LAASKELWQGWDCEGEPQRRGDAEKEK